MNIAVAHRMEPIDPAALLGAVGFTSEALADADAALDQYIAKISRLLGVGIKAADQIGRPSCLVSPGAFGYVAHAISLATQIQVAHLEVHNALHADANRLSPIEERSGPGDKEPPPKP